MWLYHVINGHFSNTSKEQNHQLPHDFAGKGVLNVLGGDSTPSDVAGTLSEWFHVKKGV